MKGAGLGLRCRTWMWALRDLRNLASSPIDAVKAGERVTLTVQGEPVGDGAGHYIAARQYVGIRQEKAILRLERQAITYPIREAACGV
jgi:antitoxin (DNA-binding transcriptional repressor) of toxin-antitoxin stability system